MPAFPANPHSLLESKRPAASRLLEKARPDFLPGDDIRRVLLMPSDAVVKLRPLSVCQRYRVRFQAFPDVSSNSAFSAGERFSISFRKSLITITLARFLPSCKYETADRLDSTREEIGVQSADADLMLPRGPSQLSSQGSAPGAQRVFQGMKGPVRLPEICHEPGEDRRLTGSPHSNHKSRRPLAGRYVIHGECLTHRRVFLRIFFRSHLEHGFSFGRVGDNRQGTIVQIIADLQAHMGIASYIARP